MRSLPPLRFSRFRRAHMKIEELWSAWQLITLYVCHAGDPTRLEREAGWHRLETHADFAGRFPGSGSF